MRPLLWCLKDHWSPTVDVPAIPVPLSPECVEGDSLVPPRGQVGFHCPSPGSPSAPAAAYRRFSVRLGVPPSDSDGCGSVVP